MFGPSIVAHHLADDGLVPNNPTLPMIIYVRCLEIDSVDPEYSVESLFNDNGWGNRWVNGIYPFQHFHSTAHEVFGIARGKAKVQFGGPNGGIIVKVKAGNAVLLPAGTGHCKLSASGDLSVVGAYPPGQDWDLLRECDADRALALQNIPHVPLPETDPVFGTKGPVLEHWQAQPLGPRLKAREPV